MSKQHSPAKGELVCSQEPSNSPSLACESATIFQFISHLVKLGKKYREPPLVVFSALVTSQVNRTFSMEPHTNAAKHRLRPH